jgi:hypothetical protein
MSRRTPEQRRVSWGAAERAASPTLAWEVCWNGRNSVIGALWAVGIDLLAVINFGLLAHRFPARRALFQALAGCFAVLGVVAVVVFVRSNKEPIPLAVGLGNGMLLAVLVILAAWQGHHTKICLGSYRIVNSSPGFKHPCP